MESITSIGEILFDVYPDKKIPGGAPFNFIYHIKKITGEGSFISRIGDDEYGKEISAFLKRNNISTELIQMDTEHPTGLAIASLDENKIPHWEIKENCAYDFIELNQLVETHLLNYSDCIYFGTLAQRGEVSANSLNKIFRMNKKFICDLNIRQNYYSKEVLDSSLKTANVLKMNTEELNLVYNLFYNRVFVENEIATRIINDFEIEMIAVTNGEEGAAIYTSNSKNIMKAKTRNVVDTVGAGDAYSAVLCLGYLRNLHPEKINTIASEFAAYIVTQRGALPANDSIYESLKESIYNDS
ncbi:MAG: hypothetical protein IPM56_18075 [Ignavibacteriales bacterium]|nr:MAG: hypothetical protein IPM56_18075 [Ignavibacteriales bacterium]